MNLNNSQTYKPMTVEELSEAFKEIASHNLPPQQRNIVVRTGSAGMKMFNDNIEDVVLREPLRNQAKELFDGGVFDEQRYNNVIAMIDSPDKENLVVAEEVMKAIKKN